MMRLQSLTAFGLRACRRGWLILPAALLTMVIGCGHHRQAYRPIFTRPAATTAPCTNCGSASRATVTTEEPLSAPSSSVPPLSSPAPVESSLTPPSAPVAGGSGAVRNSTPESPPTAKPGREPDYDELSPAALDRGNRTQDPSGSARPVTPGPAPALQGPRSGATPSTWNGPAPGSPRTAAATSSTLRRAAAGEQLQPFLGESSANELFYPDKADRPWRYIVLHHSASASGNYDRIDRVHRSTLGYDGCGYHFVIGNGTDSDDGRIEVARRWANQKQGVHCRNARTHDVDEYGIGICLVGDLDQQPPTPRQVAAARALVSYLSQRYGIEPSRVSTHAHLAATPTVCPGKFFPSQSIFAAAPTASSSRKAGAVRTAWTLRRIPNPTY